MPLVAAVWWEVLGGRYSLAGDWGMVVGLQTRRGHRPPQRVSDQRSPQFLLSEVMVVATIDRVNLHVDMTQGTDRSEIS